MNHPNAAMGTVSAGGGGALVVWLLSLLGLTVDPYIATVIAAAAAGLVLFVGRRGLSGLMRTVWRGSGD